MKTAQIAQINHYGQQIPSRAEMNMKTVRVEEIEGKHDLCRLLLSPVSLSSPPSSDDVVVIILCVCVHTSSLTDINAITFGCVYGRWKNKGLFPAFTDAKMRS